MNRSANLKRVGLWYILAALFLTLPILAFDREGAIIVNKQRRLAGMIALKNDYILSRAAYRHAKYLGRLRRKGHLERPSSPYFSGKTPFDRMARAGYPSRVGVENISYGDLSYRDSVRVLMATLYHRLAFLDFRIDSIGSSEYGNRRGRVYVYDMASSEVAKLCLKRHRASGRKVFGVCSNGRALPLSSFLKALARVQRRNPSIVLWPVPNANGVPRSFVKESPNPIPRVIHAGYPITVQFNPVRYRSVKIRSFGLFDSKGRAIPSKIIDRHSDIRHKLGSFEFALIPLRRLRAHERYSAYFVAIADGKKITKRWSFQTGN